MYAFGLFSFCILMVSIFLVQCIAQNKHIIPRAKSEIGHQDLLLILWKKQTEIFIWSCSHSAVYLCMFVLWTFNMTIVKVLKYSIQTIKWIHCTVQNGHKMKKKMLTEITATSFSFLFIESVPIIKPRIYHTQAQFLLALPRLSRLLPSQPIIFYSPYTIWRLSE